MVSKRMKKLYTDVPVQDLAPSVASYSKIKRTELIIEARKMAL